MKFTNIHPTTGARESREHIPFTVKACGLHHVAVRENGALLARGYDGAEALERLCRTMTREAQS